jgi:3-oxoacyl-[acyl-carrier protein] reductase
MNLENAKVLITGGSSGLGLATAKLLLNDGAKVCITGRDEDKLIRVATEIGASYIVFDQTDFESIPGKISDAISQLGGIDVLINNAGQGWRKELGEITIDDFQQIYGANVFGLTMVTQEVLPLFKKQNKGHIINIASTAALRGYPTGSVYASSKFALRGLTECWRAELRKFNIRVMLVNPSEVWSILVRCLRPLARTVEWNVRMSLGNLLLMRLPIPLNQFWQWTIVVSCPKSLFGPLIQMADKAHWYLLPYHLLILRNG